jgi:hypothetical protein
MPRSIRRYVSAALFQNSLSDPPPIALSPGGAGDACRVERSEERVEIERDTAQRDVELAAIVAETSRYLQKGRSHRTSLKRPLDRLMGGVGRRIQQGRLASTSSADTPTQLNCRSRSSSA